MVRCIVVAGVLALWSASRERDSKNCSSIRSAFHHDLATVILHYLLHDRKSKSGPVLFAKTYKRMKQLVLNGFRDARAIVRDLDGDRRAVPADRDLNSALAAGRGFTGIQQKVVKSAFQLARIEPGQTMAVAVYLDQRALMPRMPRCTVSVTLA
jgi:hypothetical protein